MKSYVKNAPLLLAAELVFLMVGRLASQTFTTLHNFDNSLKANAGALALSNHTLYGTMNGMFNYGGSAIFDVNTDGTGFSNLYTFDPLVIYTNVDGAFPGGEVILSSNRLYGVTTMGGGFENGSVFAVDTDGTGFTVLHTFTALRAPAYTNDDGASPGGLTLSGNTLYGTAGGAGNFGAGTVFRVNTDGTGFATLYHFTGSNDGNGPVGGLVLAGSRVYGATGRGGSFGNGTVFAINTDGTGFTNLHSFTTITAPADTNIDGAQPHCGLTISDTTLYGTTTAGGNWASGTVFSLKTDGTGFGTLHSFSARSTLTNTDGALPVGELLSSRNTLYGTADTGGEGGNGTVFALRTDGNTDGTGFTTLYNFNSSFGALGYETNNDGINPQKRLIVSGNTLYGTATRGGKWGYGTVFSLSFSPKLSLLPSGSNIVLSWPATYAGFDYAGYRLQSSSNLAPAVWSTNLPVPVVVNGQNVVTVPISSAQQFFQLSQ